MAYLPAVLIEYWFAFHQDRARGRDDTFVVIIIIDVNIISIN